VIIVIVTVTNCRDHRSAPSLVCNDGTGEGCRLRTTYRRNWIALVAADGRYCWRSWRVRDPGHAFRAAPATEPRHCARPQWPNCPRSQSTTKTTTRRCRRHRRRLSQTRVDLQGPFSVTGFFSSLPGRTLFIVTCQRNANKMQKDGNGI